MRAIRKGEEESRQSSPGWAEIRPNLFVTTGNPTGAEQTNAQHGCPLPARTRLKSTPKNVWLSASPASKLQPQLKCRFSKSARDQGSSTVQINAGSYDTTPRITRSPHSLLGIVATAREVVQEESSTYGAMTPCVRLFHNTLFPCGNLTHGEIAVSEDAGARRRTADDLSFCFVKFLRLRNWNGGGSVDLSWQAHRWRAS